MESINLPRHWQVDPGRLYTGKEYQYSIPIFLKTVQNLFFSGHTSSSAYFSFFTAKVFADTHPNSKWKPVVWGSAIALPAMTGYLRYKAGKHFPTDVIVGYGVGAAFGILIPELYKNKNFNLKVGSDQIGLVYTF